MPVAELGSRLLPLTAACLLGAAAPVGGEIPISWAGQRFTSAQLPEAFPERARTAIELWKPWAAQAGFRFDLDPDARLMLATRRAGGKGEAQLRLLLRAEKWFDDLFDPAGADSAPAAAMIVLKDAQAHADALAFVGKLEPHLASWAEKAGGQELGFVLEKPLCGAFVESAPGLKEWKPDHELLNRAVQVLLLRRAGSLPNWLAQGLAWEAERTILGSIWCYPHRAGFVARSEHDAWPGDLVKDLENGALAVFSIETLAAWPRGTFDAEHARHAWGLARYLAREKKSVLGEVLEDLRAFREKHGRTTHEDGSWELVPGYEIPAQAQAEILAKRCGDRWISEAKAWSRRNAGVR
ncbi:MAG: hypothetical protein ACKVXR_02140 [Planctomycetota bacterium]